MHQNFHRLITMFFGCSGHVLQKMQLVNYWHTILYFTNIIIIAQTKELFDRTDTRAFPRANTSTLAASPRPLPTPQTPHSMDQRWVERVKSSRFLFKFDKEQMFEVFLTKFSQLFNTFLGWKMLSNEFEK